MITASGIGSGLDINGLVTQLMALESQPLFALDQKEAQIHAKLSAYGILKGSLSSFQSSMLGLNNPAKFNSLSATIGDSSVLAATISSAAAPGDYDIEVKQLAQSQKLASEAFVDLSSIIGTGTITIDFGTFNASVFTINPDTTSESITIDSSNNTLAGIRDALNATNSNISANILNDGNGYRLVIASDNTGISNSMKVSIVDTGDINNIDNNGLSKLAFDPAATSGNGRNLIETVVAQDAILKVDGLDNITKSSNLVSDLIEGVTLTLLKTSDPGISTSLDINRDTASVKNSINNFTAAYNDLITTVSNLTAYNAETGLASTLQGDASTLNILSRIRNELNKGIETNNSIFSYLSQIGVTIQLDGTMSVDDVILQSALDQNIDDITALFSEKGSATDSLINYLSSTNNTSEGAYNINISQVATNGILVANSTFSLAETITAGTFDSPFIIDSNNDIFSIKVDGIESNVINLSQGIYNTTSELINVIQASINSDSNLKASGVKVSAFFNDLNDTIELTSDRYGSASSVEITAIDVATSSTLGFTVSSGTSGVDVQGTINGISAVGSGKTLRGSSGSNAEGLLLEVNGGGIGVRGSVHYSRGYASHLSKLSEQLLDDTGPVNSRSDGLNSSIEDIDKQRDALELRLVAIEARIRSQFSALDGLLSRLQTTSNFLTQQLSSINNIFLNRK